jgi:hypothetical protein
MILNGLSFVIAMTTTHDTGQISRQWIIPGGFPLHLSFLLQMVGSFLLSILRLNGFQVTSGSQLSDLLTRETGGSTIYLI